MKEKGLGEHLKKQGVLRTPGIIEAFRQIHRKDFVRADMEEWARLDEALPIGSGQTISQPFVVAFMLEKLQPQPGQKILDIGSGSGWTTALLAHLVAPTGKVIGIDVVCELAEFGKNNVSKYNFIKRGLADIVCKDGEAGYEKEAPFDAILVSASLPENQLPEPWKRQLRKGGTIVTPIRDSIWVFTKEHENQFTQQEYPGFVFVPFVGA